MSRRQTFHRCLSWILAFLAGMPLALPVFSQNSLYFDRLQSENIRVEQGLSQNTVSAIAQDSDGFLWIGTWDGLNKYDGYGFQAMNKENGLTNETIRAIYMLGKTLWVGTENGLNAIDITTGKVRQFFHIPGDTTSLSDNWINHLTSDHRGFLWISTRKGLTELNPETFKCVQIFSREYGNPIRSNYFNMLLQDQNYNYWIATNNGLLFVEHLSLKATRYLHSPFDSTSLPDNQVNCVVQDADGAIWIGTKNGLARFDHTSGQFIVPDHPFFRQEPNPQKEILSLFFDQNNTLWAGTNGQGLICYKPVINNLVVNTNQPNRSFTISDNRIFSIFQDRQGVLWVGSFSGLNRLNVNAPHFRTYRNDPEFPNSLSNNSVWAFEEDKAGEIWIGTENGISILNRKTGNYHHLVHQPGNTNSLSGNQIRTIRKDESGKMWVGTRYNGLSCYDPVKDRFTHYRNNPQNNTSLPDDFVLSVATANYPFIWIGTDRGLSRLNAQSGLFVNYLHQPGISGSLPNDKIYDLLIDSKKRLWVCTADGLALYRTETDDFITFQIPLTSGQHETLTINKFFSIREGHDGIFWLGTRGGGLARFEPETGAFKVFTSHHGLPNNVTYLAIEDLKGDLWITSNWGLTRFSPKQELFTNYEVTDGLQGNEFNFNAGMRAANGELFFGGMNGFNSFFPEEIVVNKTPPVIQITKFKLFNTLQNRKLRDGDTLTLKFDDNVFSFEFAALDFNNPSKIKYRYMLEGYDNSWIERDAGQRFAEYAKVSPGTYTFKVAASNSDGYWNERGLYLIVVIKSPWYGTWLFRFLVVFIVIFLVYLIVFLRMKAIRRKHEADLKFVALERQLYELEQKALQLQMNPHFLFNSLNSIQSFIVNNDMNNAIYYLSKFSQLMRRTLANSRESYVPLRDELQAIELYVEMEKLRFAGKFDFQLEVDSEIDEGFIEIPPMIIQPYVENAILHGLMHKNEKGNLKIGLSLQDENMIVLIEDNGVGRERAAEIRRESGIERKSRGMMITGERLDILNQYTKDTYTVRVIDLTNEAGQAAGTRVIITIHANNG